MKTSHSIKAGLIALFVLQAFASQSQQVYADLSTAQKKLYHEHIYQGQSDQGAVLVRQGYVGRYSHRFRIPMWVAYRLKESYLDTPKRKKKYKYFRTDQSIENAVVNSDYTGSGYARGHYAPYFAMGGDRDGDGKKSDLYDDLMDPEDDLTVFQANYMSNIAPQDQSALNGPGGPWYALETKIRTKIIPKLKDINVVVGGIILDSAKYKTIENKYIVTDIAIPDLFYQVIIYQDSSSKKHEAVAFLFPHLKERADLPYTELAEYIVPIDSVEQVANLNFFHLIKDDEEDPLEAEINLEFWGEFF